MLPTWEDMVALATTGMAWTVLVLELVAQALD